MTTEEMNQYCIEEIKSALKEGRYDLNRNDSSFISFFDSNSQTQDTTKLVYFGEKNNTTGEYIGGWGNTIIAYSEINSHQTIIPRFDSIYFNDELKELIDIIHIMCKI